jgi:hypothetical protein
MYVICSGVASVCMLELMVQGVYIFKKLVFKKSNLAVLWKKMQVRGPKAMYACVEKFRVITISHHSLIFFSFILDPSDSLKNSPIYS